LAFATAHFKFCPLEVTRHQASVRINDQLAAPSIEQEFYNPKDQRIEGTFLFPVPKGAQIKKFTMEIDGKPVEAELMSAEKARAFYEDIVRKLRDRVARIRRQDVFKSASSRSSRARRSCVSLSYTQCSSLIRASSVQLPAQYGEVFGNRFRT